MDVSEDDNPILTSWIQNFSHEKLSETTIFYIPTDIAKFDAFLIEGMSMVIGESKKISSRTADLLGGDVDFFANEKLAHLAVQTFLLFSSNLLSEEERLFEVMEDHLKTKSLKISFAGEPFLLRHKTANIDVIIQPINGTVLIPENKKALQNLFVHGHNGESYAKSVVPEMFELRKFVPDDPSDRIFFALDESKLPDFSKEFGFIIDWNVKPAYKAFYAFEEIVPLEVQKLMLMTRKDLGIDPMQIKGLKLDARDGEPIWILDVKYYLKDLYARKGAKFITVYFIDRLPELVSKAVGSRLANLTGKKNVGNLGKDVFNRITSGNLKGKDLFRACNTSSEVNRYCNSDSQLVFRNAITREFRMEVPQDVSSISPFSNPRDLYRQLHTLYFLIHEYEGKDPKNRYSIVLVRHGVMPQGVGALVAPSKKIVMIPTETDLYYYGNDDGKLFYIQVEDSVTEEFVTHFVARFSHNLSFYALTDFSRVKGFDMKALDFILYDILRHLVNHILTHGKIGDILYNFQIFPLNTVIF